MNQLFIVTCLAHSCGPGWVVPVSGSSDFGWTYWLSSPAAREGVRSYPAEKARPEPASTITPTSGSDSAHFIACISSARRLFESAFSFSGLFKVMCAILSLTSYIMSVYSGSLPLIFIPPYYSVPVVIFFAV